MVALSVTSIHLLYKREFEPIVRIGENVKLILPGKPVYGRVEYVEQIQPFIVNLGSIPAANPTQWPAIGVSRELHELDLGGSEFGQWRLALLDDFMLDVDLPSATGRFVRRGGSTFVSRLSVLRDQFTEIYTYGRDYVPKVTPLNPNFYPLDMARLLVAGYRYVIEVLPTIPHEYTVIPVAGRQTEGVG